MIFGEYDVVVVGGGHAGAEASHAAATMGAKTLLLTQEIDSIARMSCNPAMGGVAKGQIVREIDALGGMSGIVTDRRTIQFRMLNRSKGPAMWSPRAQCDKALFSSEWRNILEHTPNLSIWQDEVTSIIERNACAVGVRTRLGLEIYAKAVILTNGTFLNGRIFIGEINIEGGRIGERAAVGLSDDLKARGFEVARLKTGTPMRIDGRTIDFSKLTEQPGDENPQGFSFLPSEFSFRKQKPCYLAYTSEGTHNILRKGFDRSPMFQGLIHGRGPRYCPSIEDKIVRFADKSRHQLFVEPEGIDTVSYYLNGFSSSLPLEIQVEALHSINGFANAQILKPGYAIEYDFFPPTQLNYTLETKRVENLYFAGQINGTTGYEEAACQGLVAGVNAVSKIRGMQPFILSREQAYIGVLIDDLVTKGVDEPYRMFTSRAEYRILLRQDNADQRLTALSYDKFRLASVERMRLLDTKKEYEGEIISVLTEESVLPGNVNEFLDRHQSAKLSQRTKLATLLLRPEMSIEKLREISPVLSDAIQRIPYNRVNEIVEEVEIEQKYQRYIEKEQEVAERVLKFEGVALPDNIDYYSIDAISYEAREKLSKTRPKTIGQASRISGVSPSDVTVLLAYAMPK